MSTISKTSILIVIPMCIISLSTLVIYRVYKLDKKRDQNIKQIRMKRNLGREKFKISKLNADPDYIIVGSGMGGLSCATVLARLGFRCLVLESHPDVSGGGTHSFDLKGYRFDSGLHYTVPWSVPIFALTCGKKPQDVCRFDIMGETDGTVDKIYLVNQNDETTVQFNMKYKEKHIEDLYKLFPNETKAIDEYMKISDDSQIFVKIFLALRLLPRYIQDICWKYLVPTRIIKSASLTAKELLPQLTTDKQLIALLSSMWIDTGARPDKSSFMLTASVFRGISKEGGCYPVGGSEVMMKELVPIIEENDGQVFVRAKVKEILIENNRAVGVIMDDDNNTKIRCKKGIISGVGYHSTFNKLVSLDNVTKYRIPTDVPQSAGFVMCNLGISASAHDVGVTNTNTWHIPIQNDGDCFKPIELFFDDPLNENVRIPAFITFPSMKDKEWSLKHVGKVSCQILIMSDYSWFEKFKGMNDNERLEGYQEIKNIWLERCIEIFLKYFPNAKDKIEFADISTPLSIEYYLNAARGAAVGLDVTPNRFVDSTVRRQLDPVTDIPGLYLTGQDCCICGVTLAQLSGVITAFRITGFISGLTIILKSILIGDK